jgi:uncharacterized protein YegP (UPF0339 family)
MSYKFVISKDARGEYRVNFKYNAETIVVSEGYTAKASAQKAIQSLKTNAANAIIVDNT